MNTKKRKQEQEKQLDKEKLQAKVKSIKNQFESAMSSGDLPAAQQALANINKLDMTDNAWKTNAKIRLDNTVQTSLEISLKKGQILYSQGDINQALNVWRTAQRYAPNDKKLNDNIKRAATFQKNLLNLTTPPE